MKAIIVPLNKIFLDFEKYDGSTFAERFQRRFPKLIVFVQKNAKFFEKHIIIFLAAPFFILCLIYLSKKRMLLAL